jgi:hypothetical protein
MMQSSNNELIAAREADSLFYQKCNFNGSSP